MSYVVAATYTAAPGEEETVLSNLEAMISPTQAEPACQVYIPHRSQEDPRVFFLYERYSDEEGFKAHVASEHFEHHIKNQVWPRLAERQRVIATPLAD